MIVQTPWGTWEVLAEENDHKLKRIVVMPGHRLSYQKHAKRAEHWMILRGQGYVVINHERRPIKAGDHIDIPSGAAHRIANDAQDALMFIEIQTGTYFGEDDIVRLEDDYGRQS